MNANKIFNLTMAFVLAFSFLGIPAPVSAEWSPFVLRARLQENIVDGWGWTPGDSVTISIDDPDIGDPDYSSPVDAIVDSSGNVQFLLDGFTLQPGQIITMTDTTDGVTSKTHTVVSLSITDIDVATDTITGTTEAGLTLHGAGASRYGSSGSYCTVTTESSGEWTVHFSGSGSECWINYPSGPILGEFDIRTGTSGNVNYSDEDGDFTSLGWSLPNPRLSARLLYNVIYGDEWTPGDDVTISIDDPDIGDLDYAPQTETVDENSHVEFILNDFELQAGQIITMTDGTITKTHTIANLVVSGVDPATDTIWGVSEPDSLVFSQLCSGLPGDCALRNATARSNGTWQVDFSEPGIFPEEQTLWDLTLGMSNSVSQEDEDGDITLYPWYVRNPIIRARFHPYGFHEVNVYDWPLGTAVTVQINDPADYKSTQIIMPRDGSPLRTQATFKIWKSYDMKAGDHITVSGGGITRTHTIMDVAVTLVDLDHDVISGTAGSGISQVQIKSFNSGVNRWVSVADGEWSSNFSIPGENPGETVTEDLVTGTGGGVNVYEAEGDYTTSAWELPIPTVQVEPDQGWVDVYDWNTYAPIILTVDNDTNPNNGYIYQDIQMASPPGQYLYIGGATFHVEQDDPTVDLLPGQYITVTDLITTKITQITDVAFDYINEIDDTAGGTGPAGSSARVWIKTGAGELSLDVVIGSDGNWLADFGADGQNIQTVQDATITVYDDAIGVINDGGEDGTIVHLSCYTLTASHTGTGSDPIAFPTHSTGCPSGKYVKDASIILSGALPSRDWHISGWTGTTNDSSAASYNIVAMPASDHTATVNYLQEYILTYTAGANGSITGDSPQAVDSGMDGTEVTAVAADGYHFVAWSDGSTDNPRTDINVLANVSVTANFAIDTAIATFSSSGSYDGWILETGENTTKGGALDSTATTLRLGDDKTKKQYRSILSFKTSSLSDTAVIVKVTLKVMKQGIVGGGDPVTTFKGFMADIKRGYIGTSALQAADFQTAASKTYGPFKTALSGSWYNIDLTSGQAYINKLATSSGLTQIRLRFYLDDNNNTTANYLSLYSGNITNAAYRPQLVIEYYVP